ncbi:hypothetical protein EON65_26990 [archaeon]|nr:MAG: hypothetical protein EON65_26990 [archaeon]
MNKDFRVWWTGQDIREPASSMTTQSLLVLLIVCFYVASIKGFFQRVPYWQRRLLVVQQSLKPDSAGKIDYFRTEYEELLMKYDLREAHGKDVNPEQRRLGELNDFFESMEAIEHINEDLKMCALQMNSDNEDTRTKATTYYNEFSQLKEDLEREMNKML